MEFTLHYRGELKGNGDRTHKHTLRRYFHEQFADLWRQPPLDAMSDLTAQVSKEGFTLSEQLGSFRFVPLVSSKLYLVAELDIVLLRPGPPGELLHSGGDIDNRLKTLFDALRVPDESQLPSGATPAEDEDPYYCLLEDDKLVSTLRVRTDRLLNPKNEREVLLLIHVVTKYTQLTWGNLGL